MSNRIPPIVPMSSPDLTDADRQAVLAVLNTPNLSIGPKIEEFEAAFRKLTGARHAIGVNSGTAGLHLCVRAAGIGAGRLVVTTPFSFVSSTNVLLFEGATPVFVDVDPMTGNLDVQQTALALRDLAAGGVPPEQVGQLAFLGSFTDGATAAFLVGAGLILLGSLATWLFLDVKHEELATDGPEAYVAGAMDRDYLRVTPDMDLADVMPMMSGKGTCVLVFDGEQLVGMLTTENLSEFLVLREIRQPSLRGPGDGCAPGGGAPAAAN